MDNCKACALQHSLQQQQFPGPTFSPTTEVAESVKKLYRATQAYKIQQLLLQGKF